MRVLFGVVFAVTILLVLVRLESRRRTRKIEEAFAGRPALSSEEFFERHFEGTGVPSRVVHGVRTVLEEQLGADLSRLSSNDDFAKNLRFFFDYDSLVDVEIVTALEELFEIQITNEEAEQARTVEDIVNMVAKHVQLKDVA
jgi:acyl carrier protein